MLNQSKKKAKGHRERPADEPELNPIPRLVVVPRKSKINFYPDLDVVGLSFTQLVNIVMWGLPVESSVEEKIEQQLHEIKLDQSATAYFHLIVHAACHYAINKNGKSNAAAIHSDLPDEVVFPALPAMARRLQLDPEKLKGLYVGEGAADDFLRVMGWYSRQLYSFDFSLFFKENVIINHIHRLARENRGLLNTRREKLYSLLTRE